VVCTRSRNLVTISSTSDLSRFPILSTEPSAFSTLSELVVEPLFFQCVFEESAVTSAITMGTNAAITAPEMRSLSVIETYPFASHLQHPAARTVKMNTIMEPFVAIVALICWPVSLKAEFAEYHKAANRRETVQLPAAKTFLNLLSEPVAIRSPMASAAKAVEISSNSPPARTRTGTSEIDLFFAKKITAFSQRGVNATMTLKIIQRSSFISVN